MKNKQVKKSTPVKESVVQPKQMKETIPFNLDYRWPVLIAILAIFTYSNSIQNGYVLDDFPGIVQNELIQKGFAGIPDLFKVDFWHFANLNLGYYRPLSLITFAIEHELFGVNPSISHLINILFYALSGFVLSLLLQNLFNGYKAVIPFLICMLFVVHPIHTEVVSNIKSRDEILSFLGVISAIYFSIRFDESKQKGYLIAAIIIFYLAFLSKETAITLIAILPLSLYVFKGKTILESVLRTLPFFLVMCIFYYQKNQILGSTSIETIFEMNNYPYVESRFPSSMKLFLYFIKMLIFPYPLRYDYSYNLIPEATFSDLPAIGGLLLFGVVVFYAITLSLKRHVIGFGLMVFVVFLLPALGFIWMRGGIFAERFLYAATLGFAILLVFGIALILKFDIKESEQPDRKLLSILDPKVLSIPFVILGLLGAVYAFQRNFDWKDNRTLFSTDLAKSPESAQNNKHLAHEILQDAILEKDSVKKYALREEAIKLFRKAIAINPRFGEAWGDLGRAYHDVGFNKDSAIKFYKTTMNITPGGFNTYSNLALIYVMMGKYKLASYYFNQSLVINPNFAIGRKHKEDIKRATGYDIHEYPLDEADGPPAGIGAQVSLAPLKR